MKVFRHVKGNRYLFYIQNEDTTVLWYPEMSWRSRLVPAPEGRLLAEGSEDKVMLEIREFLPPDLLDEIWRARRAKERDELIDPAFGQSQL